MKRFIILTNVYEFLIAKHTLVIYLQTPWNRALEIKLACITLEIGSSISAKNITICTPFHISLFELPGLRFFHTYERDKWFRTWQATRGTTRRYRDSSRGVVGFNGHTQHIVVEGGWSVIVLPRWAQSHFWIFYFWCCPNFVIPSREWGRGDSWREWQENSCKNPKLRRTAVTERLKSKRYMWRKIRVAFRVGMQMKQFL